MSIQTAAGSTYSLAERAIYRRAVEAAIWGMPAVNYELMYAEMVGKVGGGFNQILFWSRLLDWKNQTLTPNPDVIYLMPFINTTDVGPMVLEIPSGQRVSSGAGAGECARHPVLVVDRLQPRLRRVQPHCPVGGPLVADTGAAGQRRWLG
jgi:hypothetical protein